jgi:hypothetical protein
MTVKELNSILVYCKVNDLYHIEYVSMKGEIGENLQETIQLYCHRLKSYETIKDIITRAKKNGYEGLG